MMWDVAMEMIDEWEIKALGILSSFASIVPILHEISKVQATIVPDIEQFQTVSEESIEKFNFRSRERGYTTPLLQYLKK